MTTLSRYIITYSGITLQIVSFSRGAALDQARSLFDRRVRGMEYARYYRDADVRPVLACAGILA